MLKSIITLGLISLSALLSPANAGELDTGLYGRVAVGTSIIGDDKRLYDGAIKTIATTEKSGLALDLSVGYDFGAIRVETQAQYSRIKNGDQGCYNCAFDEDGNPIFLFDSSGSPGKSTAKTLAVNALYDFPEVGNFLAISVGGGAGISKLKLTTRSDSFISSQKGVATNFMWQGIIEMAINITDSSRVTLRYSYEDMGKLRAVNEHMDSSTNRYSSQNYTLGLTQRF